MKMNGAKTFNRGYGVYKTGKVVFDMGRSNHVNGYGPYCIKNSGVSSKKRCTITSAQ